MLMAHMSYELCVSFTRVLWVATHIDKYAILPFQDMAAVGLERRLRAFKPSKGKTIFQNFRTRS